MKAKGTLFRSLLACVVVALVTLTACTNLEPIRREIDVDMRASDSALQKITPKGKQLTALTVDRRPWYGATAVPIKNGEPLPVAYLQPDSLVLTFEKPMLLPDLGKMIQASTGIRVIVENGGGSSEEGDVIRTFVPPDGVEVSGGRLVWQGRLPDLLNQIADSFDADWHYDGGILRIASEVTRTYMLHALAGNVEIGDSMSGDSGESGGIDYETEATLEIWEEIEDAVDNILNDRGNASFSPSTGTVTVTGAPSIVNRVENYLREQNKMRLRRIAIAVKVMAVQASDVNEVTLNLSGIFKRALEGKPFELKGVTSGLTAAILRAVPPADSITGFTAPDATNAVTTQDTDTITAILEASEEIDRASVVQSGAIVTLSDIPAPLQIGRIITYLSKVSTTVSEGTSTTSLEPSEINTGLTMNVLPRVIEKDRVLLRMSIGIREAQTPFTSFSSGTETIQLPEIETTGFMQNAVLESGETLVLAGFEKNQAGTEEEGVPGGLWTGGNTRTDRAREVTVLLITAEVLPEEPLMVLDR